MTQIAMTAARAQITASKLPEAIKAQGMEILAKIEASPSYQAAPTLGQSDGMLEDEGVTYAVMQIVEAAIMKKPHVTVHGAYDATCNRILSEITA